jgi:FMN reductase
MRDHAGRQRLLIINGSPSRRSKTAALLEVIERRATAAGAAVEMVSVRDFPAEALLFGDVTEPALQHFLEQVACASALVVATPIYKASYSGALKALLDIIPPGALAGKTVLPLATAGTLAHFLALDFALRPVLSFLGARDTLANVFLLETNFRDIATGLLDEAAEERLSNGISDLLTALGQRTVVIREPQIAGTSSA